MVSMKAKSNEVRDIGIMLRSLLSELPTESLDEMEVILRNGINSLVIRHIIADILSEKMRRLIV